MALDQKVQDLLLDLWLVQLAPYLYEHSTLSNAPGTVSVDREAYIENRTYRNLLSARALRIRNVRAAHVETLEALGLVLDLLEK